MLTLLVHVPGVSLVPAAVLLTPAIFVPVIHRAHRLTILILGWTLAAVVSGLILRAFSNPVAPEVAAFETWAPIVAWVAAIPLLVSTALWCISHISAHLGFILVAAGALLSEVINNGFAWKGSGGIYLCALILLIFARFRVGSALVLILLAGISVLNDARFVAIVALATLVISAVTHSQSRRNTALISVVRPLFAIGLAAVAGVWAMASGIAGSAVQDRTLDQLGKANFLLAARAEWGATLSLASSNPVGYGVGVRPSHSDVSDAILAVASSGGDWTSPYFSDIVFGDRVDLHSSVANMWFHFGLCGAVLAVFLLIVLLRGLRYSASSELQIGAAGTFLPLVAIWDLLFSPMADVDRLVFGLIIAIAIISFQSESMKASSAPLKVPRDFAT